MKNRSLYILLSTIVPVLVLGSLSVRAERPIDFNRDVRPIISDRCFKCHGPDAENQDSDFRLDSAANATADLGGYYGIKPGSLEESELHVRIHSSDYDRMPPPESKLELSEDEKDILDAWILAGAKYQRHWAYVDLPQQVPLPSVGNASWLRRDLDRFVLSKLEEEELQPSPEASPLRWLRRVTFDLTGLPPSLQEIEDFEKALQGDKDSAYEAVVDRLLDSQAYGEHMAVNWLDAVRYADSYGYQSDQLNTQWPYRDWVVRAFNDNMPYDEFLTEQLAGDLLEHPTRDQKLATAFNRLHRLTNEGGAIYEEWRIENVSDRVHTFGTAVLGLTLECSRCHDHKYDPITQRDYYSLSAFFNSIDENGLYDRTDRVPSPSLLLPTDQQSANLGSAKEELDAAELKYSETLKTAKIRYQQWFDGLGEETLTVPGRVFDLDFGQSSTDKKVNYHASEDSPEPTGDITTVEVSDVSLPCLSDCQGKRWACEFDGERGLTIKDVGPIDRWTPFTIVLNLRDTKRSSLRSLIAHQSYGTDAGFHGWDLTIKNGYVESRMYRVWPGNAIGVRTLKPLPPDQWHQLSATFDGSSTAEGLKLYLNGEPLDTEILRNNVVKSSGGFGKKDRDLTIGQRFRSRGFTGGLVESVCFYSRALTPTELHHLATDSPIEPTEEYFASVVDADTRQAYQEYLAAVKGYVEAEEPIHEIPVMEELPEPRETHILARGRYDAPTSDETLVHRDTFAAILPPFSPSYSRDRLGLAHWVTQPQHPLTARVAVNRLWSNFFGAGLVRTPENFGLQGEMPTHPELLDWLARDLIESGWDIKRMCKNLVLSATYRQDSVATPELLAVDPDNRLLARGPAHRLSAEQIRDLALASSGLMTHEVGGPPVSPYQPGGDLWKESNAMSPPYQQSVGKALYRRSLYSVLKRTAPLPNMMAFDATSREVCTVKRSRTNTPLQALVLMNDVQFVEAARVLAETVVSDVTDDRERISRAFIMLAGRKPDQEEGDLLLKLFSDEKQHYASNPEDAEKLINLGEKELAVMTSHEELAAMTIVCQTILNLDATIWER